MPVTPQYENFADAFMSDDDEILIQAYGSTGFRIPGAGEQQIPKTNGSFSRSDADSEILMNRADEIAEKHRPPTPKHWWRHPKVRENYRMILASFVLTVVGTICIVTGIVVQIIPTSGLSGWVFIFAGLICFIPGGKIAFSAVLRHVPVTCAL